MWLRRVEGLIAQLVAHWTREDPGDDHLRRGVPLVTLREAWWVRESSRGEKRARRVDAGVDDADLHPLALVAGGGFQIGGVDHRRATVHRPRVREARVDPVHRGQRHQLRERRSRQFDCKPVEEDPKCSWIRACGIADRTWAAAAAWSRPRCARYEREAPLRTSRRVATVAPPSARSVPKEASGGAASRTITRVSPRRCAGGTEMVPARTRDDALSRVSRWIGVNAAEADVAATSPTATRRTSGRRKTTHSTRAG